MAVNDLPTNGRCIVAVGGEPATWHRCKDLNLGHTVLETVALPTELHPYITLDVLAPSHPGDCLATRLIGGTWK